MVVVVEEEISILSVMVTPYSCSYSISSLCHGFAHIAGIKHLLASIGP